MEADDGEWIVEGPLSEPSKDLQGESMRQGKWGTSGLRKGLAAFLALGKVVDWEHLYEKFRDPEAIIGKGLELFDAPHPVTGADVPWLRVRLLKGQRLAQKVWGLLKAGGSLGFSVAGAAVERLGSEIVEPMITTIGITAVPVQAKNAGTLQVAKALEALAAGDMDVFFPFVPELAAEGVVPEMRLFRALEASGALPHAGPGADALGVEDLAETSAGTEEDEEERLLHLLRKRRQRRLKPGIGDEVAAVRKALAYQLYHALSERLVA